MCHPEVKQYSLRPPGNSGLPSTGRVRHLDTDPPSSDVRTSPDPPSAPEDPLPAAFSSPENAYNDQDFLDDFERKSSPSPIPSRDRTQGINGSETSGHNWQPDASPNRSRAQQIPERSASRRYHNLLDAKICNKNGEFYKDGEPIPPPPPRHQREEGDWYPFANKIEFEMAEFVYCKTQMSEENTNHLMEMITSLRGGSALFSNHKDICETIDASVLGDVPWQRASLRYEGAMPASNVPEWMSAEYEIYYRDPTEVVKNIIADPTFDGAFDYTPYQEFDKDGKRQYENLMSGDWAFRQADIISEDEATHGAMFVPVILGSDKTIVSVGTGHNEYWPLYCSAGNLSGKARRSHANGVVLIGFLSIPKTDKEHAGSDLFRNFRRQMFHALLAEILSSLRPAMEKPILVRCPDGHFRLAIFGLGPYIADYPEQVLLSCIVQGWCPKCTANYEQLDEDKSAFRRSKEFTEAVATRFELLQAWDLYGVIGDAAAKHFPRADIHELITPDLLHQIIKGTFKDHLVDWVGEFLVKKYGKQGANRVIADIDRKIAAAAPFSGLRRFPQGRGFKQWTGDDSKALMKVYLPAIEEYVPTKMVRCFRAFLEFCYIARHDVITEKNLEELKNALERFHHYRTVFSDHGISPGFSLPRQHSMTHYYSMIRLFGAPNGLCSSITEAKHIKAVKEPWRRSNRYQPLNQILYINQRLDKLAAMRTDFTDRGMLEASGLRAALNLIEKIRSEHNPPADGNEAVENDENGEDDDDYGQDSRDVLPSSEVKLARRICSRVKQSEIAAQFDDPELVPLFRRFLYELKYPGGQTDANEVSIDACPNADAYLSIVRSAAATFHSPSDPTGVIGRRTERIRATALWRNGSSRYDTVLVKTGLAPGPHGLSVGRLRLLFSFKFEGTVHSAALVEWFAYVGDAPDEDTGMWLLQRETRQDGSPWLDFVDARTILRACHLLPVFGHLPLPREITHENSLDVFNLYYLNKFADHHLFEILS